MKYEDFTLSMEPRSLIELAGLIRAHAPRSAELVCLACEIESRMLHIGVTREQMELSTTVTDFGEDVPQSDDSWLDL